MVSPYINRFIQPDTLIPSPANPQAFNRYSYVMNSPINFNDPTGHMCSDPDDPTPSCDGSGTPPPNTTPLPDDEVYTPPHPLDDGLDMGDDDPYAPQTNNSDIIIDFDLDDLPFQAYVYSNIATSIDIFLLVLSIYMEALSITGMAIGYSSGAAFTGGTPVTGMPGAFVGYSLVQLGLQSVMTASNYLGLFATAFGTIGDDKSGNSEIGFSVLSTNAGIEVNIDAKISSNVQASWLITYLSFQGEAQLTETSLLLQAASVANDYNALPSMPWGTRNFSKNISFP